MALQRIKHAIRYFSPYFMFILVGMGLMAFVFDFYLREDSWVSLRDIFYVIEAVVKLY